MALFESHPDRVRLQQENVGNSWNDLLAKGAGKGEKFFEEIERAVNAAGIPDIEMKRVEVEFTGGSSGAKWCNIRPALFIHGTVDPTNYFNIYFSAQDFGKHLILSRVVVERLSVGLNQFQSEVLTAHFTAINTAMTAAVAKLTAELNQDLSKTDAQSKGIVDIA